MSKTILHELLDDAKSTAEIYELLRICDIIHFTGKPYKNYTPKDLPPDDVYEHYVHKINYETDTSITESTILYMSTIPKEKEVVEIENAIGIPKFDGVSVAAKFTITDDSTPHSPSKNNSIYNLVCANTRGKTTGTKITNTDITDKVNALVKYISTNNDVIIKYIKNDCEKIKKDSKAQIKILNIVMRGEIVLNHKSLDNSGNVLNAPSSEVAGPINGKLETFKEKIDDCCIQFYEIGYINYTYNNKLYKFIPTQKEACFILKKMYVYYNYTEDVPSYISNPCIALDAKIYKFKNTIDIDFDAYYADLLADINYPTDGIVYCAEDWKYPQELEKFGKKDYGKHAWKPSSYHYVNVEKVEWPITKQGELNPIVYFERFKFNGTIYTHCKMTVAQIIDYQPKFGIGAELNVNIVNMKTAHIDDVLKPATEPYKLPTKCPYCNGRLTLEEGKTKGAKHLMCRNENCIEQKIQNYAFLISSLAKIAKGELVYKNKLGKVVKSGISEKKLREIVKEHEDLNINIIELYIPNLIEVLDNQSLANQLYCLSFGGMTVIDKMLKEDNKGSWREYNVPWLG